MKNAFYLFSIFSLILSLSFTSCKKNVRKGCTDFSALNYNYLAEEDDGTCEYLDSSFTIWSNGVEGYWGDPVTGTFEVKSCLTDSYLSGDTVYTAADTTITPADTIIDNNVTPPDTTYIPADTTITLADTTFAYDGNLLVNSDESGNYELLIKLLNKKSAVDFKNGYLIFQAKLHPEANINDFGIFIHGNHLNPGGSNCDDFYYSDLLNISSSILDTSSFKEVIIPLTDFSNRHMQEIDVVFGVKGLNAEPNTSLIYFNNIRWVSKKPE